ncbi:MAG: hypothetical protein AVDCRST_MAG19-3608 [uncultured Thermomicrobiales bacterium]|uniref:Uncharacterized protein n=1 Tax=uncultured Thermomicrobiales bacterium TaxID=1645740 RepID=A0A6J4VGX7_9BACT|nr:MAG: hypothetical protein AVDCRST_MAG19-3608 [uncultured Thermomicrobiales bacterium]
MTVAGYGSFIAGPVLVGSLAAATSLRTALLPLVGTTLGIALLARRVPDLGVDKRGGRSRME